MVDYPGSLYSPTDKEDKVDQVSAAHMNEVQDEIEAIEAELGTDVAGSATDLKTRLAVSIADDGASQKGSSLPGSPVAGQFFFKTDEDVLYVRNAANDAWLPQGEANFSDGSILEAAADTERSHTSSTYTKYKEISIPKNGEITVSFQLKSWSSGQTVYGRVYRNGVAVGTEQSTSSDGYSTKSESISGWSAGDLCQLYLKGTGVVDAYAKEFRIKASNPTTSVVLQD